MKRTRFNFIAIGLLCAIAPCLSVGQTTVSDTTLKIIDSTPENSPLVASGQVSVHQEFTAETVTTQYTISAEMTNTSTKPIIAYEVSIDARPEFGGGLHHVGQADYFFKKNLELVAGGREDISVPPGFTESMAFNKDKTQGVASSATFKVIFVQFADGTTFGHSTWGSTLSQARNQSLSRIQQILSTARSSPSSLQASLTTEVDRRENPGITRALMSHVRDTLAKSGPDAAMAELNDFLNLADQRKLVR
jgi:hypothetical protein